MRNNKNIGTRQSISSLLTVTLGNVLAGHHCIKMGLCELLNGTCQVTCNENCIANHKKGSLSSLVWVLDISPFCIGDGSPIGVASENIKDASKLPTRGADAKGTV